MVAQRLVGPHGEAASYLRSAASDGGVGIGNDCAAMHAVAIDAAGAAAQPRRGNRARADADRSAPLGCAGVRRPVSTRGPRMSESEWTSPCSRLSDFADSD